MCNKTPNISNGKLIIFPSRVYKFAPVSRGELWNVKILLHPTSSAHEFALTQRCSVPSSDICDSWNQLEIISQRKKMSGKSYKELPTQASQADLVRLLHVFVGDIAWSPEMPANRLRNWCLEGPHVSVRASVKRLNEKTLRKRPFQQPFLGRSYLSGEAQTDNEAKTFNCFSHLPLSEDVVFPVRMLCLSVWNPPDSARSRKAALPKSEPHHPQNAAATRRESKKSQTSCPTVSS